VTGYCCWVKGSVRLRVIHNTLIILVTILSSRGHPIRQLIYYNYLYCDYIIWFVRSNIWIMFIAYYSDAIGSVAFRARFFYFYLISLSVSAMWYSYPWLSTVTVSDRDYCETIGWTNIISTLYIVRTTTSLLGIFK